jgi:hypothetical protein
VRDDLVRPEAKLLLHVQRAGREEDVDAGARRVRERSRRGVDVVELARQSEATVTFVPRARRRGRLRSRRARRRAKPASITSTPSRSSCSPISTFSSGRSAIPGACSPSRSVVSKIVILRELKAVPP